MSFRVRKIRSAPFQKNRHVPPTGSPACRSDGARRPARSHSRSGASRQAPAMRRHDAGQDDQRGAENRGQHAAGAEQQPEYGGDAALFGLRCGGSARHHSSGHAIGQTTRPANRSQQATEESGFSPRDRFAVDDQFRHRLGQDLKPGHHVVQHGRQQHEVQQDRDGAFQEAANRRRSCPGRAIGRPGRQTAWRHRRRRRRR